MHGYGIAQHISSIRVGAPGEEGSPLSGTAACFIQRDGQSGVGPVEKQRRARLPHTTVTLAGRKQVTAEVA